MAEPDSNNRLPAVRPTPEARVVIPPAPAASSEGVRKVMQGNRGRETKPEIALRSELHRRGLRFRKHARPLKGLRCAADVVFPREKVAVFVDGCFWHRCPAHSAQPQTNRSYWSAKIDRNVQRDDRNNRMLSEAGWEVVRVWEHEPPGEAAAAVEERVLARRAA